MENITLGKKEVIIKDKILLFDYPILKCLEISSMLIVLLEIPTKTTYNNNVFGVSLKNREIKWQINVDNTQTRFNKDCSFTNILVYEGKLRLNNWCSFDLFVDPSTGDILETIESR